LLSWKRAICKLVIKSAKMISKCKTKMASKKSRTPQVCTALHIVKGALVKVLNTPLTTGVVFNSKTCGRIAVQYEGAAPTDDLLKKVEELANSVVSKNLPVQVLKMNRAEAEEKFKKQPVNGTYIYDKYAKLPETITELSLVLIEDWNVNGCPGDHLPSTGGVGTIKIVRINHRHQKQELEFIVEISPGTTLAPQPAAEINQGKAATPASIIRTPSPHATVHTVRDVIVHDFFDKLYAELEGNREVIDAIKAKEEKLSESFSNTLTSTLCAMRNAAYTAGFTAHIPPNEITTVHQLLNE